MYSKLLDYISKSGEAEIKEKFSNLRLLMSGSAPLSQSLAKHWTDTTGTQLLERYGATETGMILSNPINGPRHLGHVGMPLPSVNVRLVEPSGGKVVLTANDSNVNRSSRNEKDEITELEVSGDSIFTHYLNRDEDTKKAFSIDENGTRWYKTGDSVSYSEDLKSFKVNGRLSSDIIKSGGYKLSALDIETKLNDHPNIKECSVVGIPDEEWGEKVVVAVQYNDPVNPLKLEELQLWCADRMPKYWIPRQLRTFENGIPKNQMGKVNKKQLRTIFESN